MSFVFINLIVLIYCVIFPQNKCIHIIQEPTRYGALESSI